MVIMLIWRKIEDPKIDQCLIYYIEWMTLQNSLNSYYFSLKLQANSKNSKFPALLHFFPLKTERTVNLFLRVLEIMSAEAKFHENISKIF